MKTFNKVSASVLTIVFLVVLSVLPVSVHAANAVEYGLITSQITASDLGVDSVGTLPTSPFYFLKQWSRGIQRLFTFGPTAKAQLELNIENQTAAEVYEVVNSDPSDAAAIQAALQNLTSEQERLNGRITAVSSDPTDANVAKFLKDVDAKTALHAALLEQLGATSASSTAGIVRVEGITELVGDLLLNANDNILKTFTFTLTNTGGATTGAISLKQKAADEIAKATTVYGQAVTFTATVTASAPGAGTPSVHINNDGLGQAEATVYAAGASGGVWKSLVAKAKSNLDSAKAAFAAGKYGEAYGLARSAEALAAGVRVAVGDVNGDGKPDLNAASTGGGAIWGDTDINKKVSGASSTTPSKPSFKVTENESPRPSDRKETTPAASSTSEKEKTDVAPTQPATTESTTSEPASHSDAGKPEGNPMGPNSNQGAAGSPTL